MTDDELKRHLLTYHNGLLSEPAPDRDTFEMRDHFHREDHQRFPHLQSHEHKAD